MESFFLKFTAWLKEINILLTHSINTKTPIHTKITSRITSTKYTSFTFNELFVIGQSPRFYTYFEVFIIF